jgi:hypothetical protein
LTAFVSDRLRQNQGDFKLGVGILGGAHDLLIEKQIQRKAYAKGGGVSVNMRKPDAGDGQARGQRALDTHAVSRRAEACAGRSRRT